MAAGLLARRYDESGYGTAFTQFHDSALALVPACPGAAVAAWFADTATSASRCSWMHSKASSRASMIFGWQKSNCLSESKIDEQAVDESTSPC
jgi:hypothetical protein